MANKPVARKNARKPRRPVSGRSDLAAISIIGIIAIVAAFIYQSFNTDGFRLNARSTSDGTVSEIHATGDIRLNEIMSANDTAFYTSDGETSDWVEVMNCGSFAVDITGYTLAKKNSGSDQFIFPSTVLDPGECALVFCDNKVRNTAGYEFHAPFGISRAGDTLMLFNAAGTAVDTVNIPEMTNNMSYSRMDAESWQVTGDYTPGLANTYENHATFVTPMAESPLEITELMASNKTYAPDNNGFYHDYIELHNNSGETIDISGYHLSDDRNDVMKWTFPEGTAIGPDGYLLVYASGLETTGDGQYHASFKLSSEGEAAVISNEKGQIIEIVEYGLLSDDQAWSRGSDGSFGTNMPPTPGMANTQESAALISDRFAAQNFTGIYITEVSASNTQAKYDWVEIYNASSGAVDLSGYGFSDNTGRPRKWTFPQGTTLGAGQYLGVFVSGITANTENKLHASFRLGAEGGYTLCLSTPEGLIFDRMYVPQQFSDISYGRLPGQYGRCYYFTSATPAADNGGSYYARKASPANYSVSGGLYDAGETLTVELTAEPGDRIYYTTDFTDPTEASSLYTGPITITDTTVLRTRVYADGALESYMSCQTYFFGISHTMRVVSLVSDPYNLTSDEAGIMVKGPNALPDYPYGSMNKGANFWMDWEREGHVEIYDTDGTQMVSQEMGLKLHGQFSRAEPQKAFKVYARNKYSGTNRFYAPLFDNLDYTEYKSFILRASGSDGDRTRMRDSVLTSLARGTSVMWQETELCVVYINGAYWGHYNMRQHINSYSICQFEGWEGQEADIDIVKANNRVMQGSNDTFAALLEWVKNNDTSTDAAYEKIGSVIDIQNYIEYMSLEIFTGNTDTLNVKRYRNANDDGLWRWIYFDLDWAFYTDTDSIARWLTPGGMGAQKRTDNTLFIACMKNPRFREEFLVYFGQQMATTFTTANVVSLIQARHQELLPEMERQAERWGPDAQTYSSEMAMLVNYAKTRPTKLLGYFKKALDLSNEDMQRYFGDAAQAIKDYESSGS